MTEKAEKRLSVDPSSDGTRPKYEVAKAAILRRIGTMHAGSKLPSVQALHEELGLSQGTIMRAIDELEADGVVERRRNRGAFVARPMGRANNILVVWPDLIEQVTRKPLSIHPNTSRILHSVQEAAGKLNKNLLITRRLLPEHPEFGTGRNQVSGVLTLFNYDRRFVEAFRARNIPVVLIDPLVRVRGVPFVMKDHCENSREATLNLIDKGHRHIVHITIDRHLEIPGLENSDEVGTFVVQERIRGYELAMGEAGLKDLCRVYRSPATAWSKADKDDLFDVLSRADATAVCCFNDDLASRVLYLCQERGLSVPRDLSIIGHDDAEIASLLQPGLSTIRPPLEDLGTQAVRLLAQQIEAGKTEGYGIILPSQVVERESVRPLHAQDREAPVALQAQP
jgi:GntR family transcriptional regulator of arabinose operon